MFNSRPEKIVAENSQGLLEKNQHTHMHIDTHIFKVTNEKGLFIKGMVMWMTTSLFLNSKNVKKKNPVKLHLNVQRKNNGQSRNLLPQKYISGIVKISL